MSFQLTGKLKKIDPIVQVSDKFSKREFVITDESSQYPQDVLFQITQDKCTLLDKFNVGDTVQASFNLRGREWTSPTGEVKYFNTLEAWRIEKVGQGNAMPAGGPSAMSLGSDPIPAATTSAVASNEEEDDLPF